jgi:hypothetical protein
LKLGAGAEEPPPLSPPTEPPPFAEPPPKAPKAFAVAAIFAPIPIPAPILFKAISAAAKAAPPGNKEYFKRAAEFAACVFIIILEIPIALSAIKAAFCKPLFFSNKPFNKPIPCAAVSNA